MGRIGEVKARRLLRALLKLGFVIQRQEGSHRFLKHPDGRLILFTFHEGETVGPKMIAKVRKDAKLTEEELRRAL